MLSRSSRNPSSRSSIDRLLGGPQGRLWATEERDKKSCGVPERSGTHSDVRLAVVPLSGEFRSGCAPSSMEIYAKSSKNVRLQSNPSVGVNHGPFLRLTREKTDGGRRRKPRRTTHRGSPPWRVPSGDAAQLFGYVEETTRRGSGHNESAEVNYRGKQIRV